MVRVFNKKADGTVLSLETMAKLFLVVIVLFALYGLTAKLLHMFSSNTEEATQRNFETLIATVRTMEEGTTFSEYPLYIKEDYVIVGYKQGSNAILGTCTRAGITEPTYNTKPVQCGLEDSGCLCLCKTNDDFKEICHDEKTEVSCMQANEELLYGYSFIGGTSAAGSCDFAVIYGNDNPQTIYLEKTKNTVKICTEQCS